MRASVALAGSAAVMTAVLVAGCGSDTSGSPVAATTTGSSAPSAPSATGGGGAATPSLPAIDTRTLEQPDPLESLAGDWRQETTSKPIQAHVAKDGSMTLTQGGQTITGQLVWMGDKHFRILILASQGKSPEITADLSADGDTMTVHSSEEPGPIVYKRVG